MKDRNLMILAAGISSRMKKAADTPLSSSLTHDVVSKSKSMIGVGPEGRPFLDYLLFNARQAGYVDILLVVGEQNQAMRETYGAMDHGNAFHGLSISYAVQRIPEGGTKPLGTADAVLTGLRSRHDWSHRSFTVCNSDNLYSPHAMALLLESPSECSMADYDRASLGSTAERVGQFAVLMKDRTGALLEIIEKPTLEDIARCSDFRGRVGVSMNLFRFHSDLIRPALERTPLHPYRLEKELPTAVVLMVKDHPGCLMTYPVTEEVPDLTGRGDIAAVQEYLSKQHKNFSW